MLREKLLLKIYTDLKPAKYPTFSSFKDYFIPKSKTMVEVKLSTEESRGYGYWSTTMIVDKQFLKKVREKNPTILLDSIFGKGDVYRSLNDIIDTVKPADEGKTCSLKEGDPLYWLNEYWTNLGIMHDEDCWDEKLFHSY